MQFVVGQLFEEADRRIQDQAQPPAQFGDRQHLEVQPVHAHEFGHVGQHLPVGPAFAFRHDRHLAQAKMRQLFEGLVVAEHVARGERDAVTDQELFGAKATGATRLPVDADLV